MPVGGLTTGPRNLLRQIREAMAGASPAQDRLDTVVRIIAQSMVAEVCSIYLRRASGEKGGPEADTPPQQRRDQQEHRQRRDHIPEGRLRMIGEAGGIAGVAPQPDHAEHRHQRQRRQ